MVAELAPELSFASEDAYLSAGSRLVIPEEELQPTEVIRGRARVSRGVNANYTLEVPEYISSDVVDVFVKGCGAAEAAYVPLRKANAQLGKISLTVGSPRGTVIGDLLSPQNMLHAERYQQQAVSAALDDIESLHGLARFRAKGHSMGGRDALAVTEDSPERIEGLTFISAAGLERHHLLMLAGRVIPFVGGETAANFNLLREEFQHPRALTEQAWHILSNPLRMGVDVVSISQADLRPRIRALGDKSVRVAILDVLADALIPNKSVEKGIGSEVDLYKMHDNPYLGHLAPQVQPLEIAMELHRMDQKLFPDEVLPPRSFAVQAMGRGVKARHLSPAPLALVS